MASAPTDSGANTFGVVNTGLCLRTRMPVPARTSRSRAALASRSAFTFAFERRRLSDTSGLNTEPAALKRRWRC